MYSSDALRISESVQPGGTSGKAYGEARQVLEHLWLVHTLRLMERQGWLRLLPQLAFVMDGPLAIHGHPAWLSTCIQRELARVNDKVREAGLPDIMVLGIEKTGNFVDHFAMLDVPTKPEDEEGLPRSSCWLLDDKYIKLNIIYSDSKEPYGRKTYYGRKCFFKTASGARIVANVAFLSGTPRNVDVPRESDYPRLPDILAVLEGLVSSRYPNALIPLSVAHSEAAIPLSKGKKLLKQHAEELLARGTSNE